MRDHRCSVSARGARKYAETVAWAQRALDIDPRHLLAREFIAGVDWTLGYVERFSAENLKQAKVCGVPDEDVMRHIRARRQGRTGASPAC